MSRLPIPHIINTIKTKLGFDRTMTAPGEDIVDAVNKQSQQIDDLQDKVGTSALTTTAQNLSDAVNELNTKIPAQTLGFIGYGYITNGGQEMNFYIPIGRTGYVDRNLNISSLTMTVRGAKGYADNTTYSGKQYVGDSDYSITCRNSLNMSAISVTIFKNSAPISNVDNNTNIIVNGNITFT